jgi:hypothetical protein
MSTLLDNDLTESLQQTTIAVSMKMKRFGNSKKVDEDSHQAMTRVIQANADRIKATELIVNSKHPAYQAVTSHLSKTKRAFVERTVSFPEPTIRLMNIDKLERFQEQVAQDKEMLVTLVNTLNRHRDELVQDARRSLGNAFREEYYPTSFTDHFGIDVSYPTIGPDDRLKFLSPDLYEEQRRRFALQMDQAIQETTQALAIELETIFGRIASTVAEGKTVKSNMLDPLHSFLDRFQDLRVGSTEAMRTVVDQARQILSQANPTALQRSATARTSMAQALAPLQQSVSAITERVVRRRVQL